MVFDHRRDVDVPLPSVLVSFLDSKLEIVKMTKLFAVCLLVVSLVKGGDKIQCCDKIMDEKPF